MSGKNNKIKFSVLVPVYNCEAYLDECIQSVLNQTNQEFELILVNDGSIDGSGEICDRYAAEFKKVFAYHKSNRGQLHARQYAIERACGDYYVFLDSDDTLCPNALQIISEKIQQYNCDCLIFQMERVHEGEVVESAPHMEDVCITDKRTLYRRCFMATEYNSMCRKAVKASVFKNCVDYSNWYHIRMGEDLLQSLAVLKYSKRVAFVGDVLYRYRMNPESVTHSIRFENYKISFFVRERILSFLKTEDVWDKDDYETYRGYCAHTFCFEIIRICEFPVGKAKKKNLLEELRSTSYFQEFLAVGKCNEKELGKRRIIFRLFLNRYDNLLILVVSVFAKVNKLLRGSKDVKKE